MCATKDSLLLKGFQRSMSSWAASRLGVTASAGGRSHSCDRTYEPSTSRFDILSLRGLAFASLAENDSQVAISDGASPTTLLASGGPPAETPSSSNAQASPDAS